MDEIDSIAPAGVGCARDVSGLEVDATVVVIVVRKAKSICFCCHLRSFCIQAAVDLCFRARARSDTHAHTRTRTRAHTTTRGRNVATTPTSREVEPHPAKPGTWFEKNGIAGADDSTWCVTEESVFAVRSDA